MIETYYAGAYWRARPESAEECARRAQSFFLAMGEIDPYFARWFMPPRSRKQPPDPLALDVPKLQEVFTQGRTRNDDGGVIEDLGFHLSVDNGKWPGHRQREFASLWIKCGGYAEHMGHNSCVLSLPSDGVHKEQLLTPLMQVALIRAMALAWEPEWGVATSRTHREQMLDRGTAGLFVGWVSYFSQRRGILPALPSPVRVEPIEDRGTLVILTPERFTASNPEHVALAAHVQELLDGAGLLKPL